MQNTENVREKGKTILTNLLQKKESDDCDEEIMIHQKALYLQSLGNNYVDSYMEILYDVCTLIEKYGIYEAFEHLQNGKIGFDSPLFDWYVDQEKRDIMNLTKPIEVEEGIYTCPKCKGKKTHHYSRQMRSADEPATTIITCVNKDCQYSWKIN